MTRLADVDEMAQVPPDGVRMGLSPGDVAGLYAVSPVSLDGWGQGMEPFEALVTHVPVPGVYLGELTDGSPVEFEERNVAWVRPSMGGIFDWIKRPARASEQPVPGLPWIAPGVPPGLPALPAPPSPPSPVKEMFLKIFAPSKLPSIPAGEKSTIFDWFRPKAPVSPGPPAFRPETPIAPIVERPSMFTQFAPGAPGILERVGKKMREIIPFETMGPLIQTPEMFKHIKPTPEKTFENVQQRELWTALFPEPEPGKQVPLSEMFRPFTREEIQPQMEAELMPPVSSENLKILPLPVRNALLPTPMDVARAFITRYEPIEELWDLIRQARQDPSFQRAVAKGMSGDGPGARFEFETLGMCDGNPNVFEALAGFLQIPWDEVMKRGEPDTQTDDAGNEYTTFSNVDRIYEEITFPASELVFQAFEMIKPQDLPGTFMLEWGGHKHSCQLVVTYAEGLPYAGAGTSPSAVFQQPEAAPQFAERSTTIGELMPPEAAEPTTQIINALRRGEITPGQAHNYLMGLFVQHGASLEAKGVLPEYLATVLLSTVMGH